MLIEEGSLASVQALEYASATLSEINDFHWWLVSAREHMRRNTWQAPTPRQLRTILHNSQRRFVRSGEELLSVLEESLKRLQVKLKGNNPTAFFLWDKQEEKKQGDASPGPKKRQKANVLYRHKDENSLSDFVKMHLEYDLKETGIIINREVEIRRSTGAEDGERTDIHIQAWSGKPEEAPITVILETKGCWNDELDDAMETQLKNRYLSDSKNSYGLFLIGWFYGKHFKAPAKHRDRDAFDRRFVEQASRLSDNAVTIKSFVIDCSL